MTQPDDWTQDHTDALGDVAWDKIIAEIDAAEADARECRAERASYGDAMTEKLAAVEAERDAARREVARLRAALASVLESLYATHNPFGTDTAIDEIESYISAALTRRGDNASHVAP